MDTNDRTRGLRAHNEATNRIVRESITEALFILMKTTPYEKISVSQIARKAGISRAGFYGNYTGKDDVFEEAVLGIVHEVTRIMGSRYEDGQQGTRDYYLRLFTYFDENMELFQTIAKAGFEGRFLYEVNRHLQRIGDPSNEEIVRRLCWNGAMENLAWTWCKRPNRASVEQMADYAVKYLER